MVEGLGKIEIYLWEYQPDTASFSASSIRSRSLYLISLNRVIRMESVYLADIYDIYDFMFHQKMIQSVLCINIKNVQVRLVPLG